MCGALQPEAVTLTRGQGVSSDSGMHKNNMERLVSLKTFSFVTSPGDMMQGGLWCGIGQMQTSHRLFSDNV